MHSSLLLVGASLGFVAARSSPYMLYGVPRGGPDIDINEVADTDVLVDTAADNTTIPSNTTQAPSISAAPTAPSTPGLAEPCAVVSSAVSALPSGTRKVVPAELAVQCLQSVPLDRDGNVKLIDDLKLYLQWQSNLAFLKNPPPEYTELPVDLIGEMESMQRQLSAGGYSNEYDFQLDLNQLFNRAYDNHLTWQPDILAGVMQFQRPAGMELVSVSSDGKELPEIFAYRDLELARNVSSFNPSPVRTINGEGVEEYLQKVAVQADFHDADTRWNALFPSQALIASGVTFLGSFRTGMYQGPNTTLSFANGTTRSQTNVAVVFANFTGVDSGPAFFKKFCSGPQPTASPTPSSTPSPTTNATSTRTAIPSHTGYPQAVLLNPNLSLGGYHINDTGYDDVAVLSIPSYESPDVQRFQNVMRDFIRLSRAAGKTKLIFDMRGNGGGNAILGYDTFKQAFPQADKEPFGGTRYRANEALNVAGQMTRDFADNKTYAQSNETAFTQAFNDITQNDIFLYTVGFNFEHQLDASNKRINSWEQMFGPEQVNGDSFTATIRYNFTDEASYTYPGFSVIGFRENANETQTPQPFKAEDIVMLHDGMCSSTCTIASELLKNQGGVRTIAVGGQPRFGPMQGIGGTKGAQSFEYDDVQIRTQIVYFLGSPEQQEQWNQTALGKTAFAEQMFKRSAYSADGRPAGGINLRDNLRQNDASKTPLEFIYEAADCRMFYTAPMIGDVTMVWKGVVDRMFRTDERKVECVQGSTGDPSSVSGGGQTKSGTVPPPPQNAGVNPSSAAARMVGGRLGGLSLLTTVLAALYL
ncbi:peptidase S41 family protein [Lentithecium fluviatile CBS 122367]|uniref:Peptidase S41 family protein n=1 Tax=Lentithecium fluviatile CBS 122367 TaxID=1168545 RepID=A0A6G1J607_9PLEO|nr:peptidase S41 family protein [Lentithecium fluviatile CBS 122367]